MSGRPKGISLLGILWILSSLYELGGAAATFHTTDFYFFIAIAVMFVAAAVGTLLAKTWAYSLAQVVYPVLLVWNTSVALSSGLALAFVSIGGSTVFALIVYYYFKRVNVREYFQQS